MRTHIYLPHPLERSRLSHEPDVLENQTENALFFLEALLRKRDGNVEGSAVALVCGCSAREALYQACIRQHTSAYVGIRRHTPRKRRSAGLWMLRSRGSLSGLQQQQQQQQQCFYFSTSKASKLSIPRFLSSAASSVSICTFVPISTYFCT